ncbi:MAG: hypothetical protein H6625_03695 [Bdellovibrionaceae bacterium]|nr:hypothetical protein [Pseudobdellovibrionaceae bacterium]
MSFLLGESSFQNIKRLNCILNDQARRKTELAKGIQFPEYEPWMCSSQSRKRFSILKGNFQKKQSPEPVVDLNRLILLKRAISESKCGHDLHYLLPEDQNRKIMDFSIDNSTNFELEVNHCINYINRFSPSISTIFSELIYQIVPLVPKKNYSKIRQNGSGFSTHEFRGVIFLSLAVNTSISRFENLLNLVHELAHQVLFLYQCSDSIIADDLYKSVYSVIRKTERPAIQSFHALVASAYMLQFCLDISHIQSEIVETNYFKSRVSELKNYLYEGLNAFENINFTKTGDCIYSEISKLLFNDPEKNIASF